MRLAKYLARAGLVSRRAAEEIIRAGRVRVNGAVTVLPQAEVSESDLIQVDGSLIAAGGRKYYILLDKPAGFISTAADTHNRPTVLDLVREIPARLYPVGRLDADTEGLLLLTNDGELTYRLTHPRFGVKKTYRAWVKGVPNASALAAMRRGLTLDGRRTAPAGVRLVKAEGGERALLEIVLTEGRKRQVRRMCAAAGYPVLRLRRTRFAFLTARGLRHGRYRHLTPGEVRRLYKETGACGGEHT